MSFKIVFSIKELLFIFAIIVYSCAEPLNQLFQEMECMYRCQDQFSFKECKKVVQEKLFTVNKTTNCTKTCIANQDICLNLCTCLRAPTSQEFKEHLNDQIEKTWIPELHCRNESMLVFNWQLNQTEPKLFVLQLKDSNGHWQENITTIKNLAEFKNLMPNTTYALNIWKLTENGWTKSQEIFTETLPLNYTLDKVTNITLESLTFQPGTIHYKALLKWTPGKEKVCSYDIVRLVHSDIDQKEIDEPEKLYNIEFDDLDFGKNYSVAIIAVSLDRKIESDKEWIIFNTPTCLETFKNLTICAPPMPTDLEAKEILLDFNANDEKVDPLYNVMVKWKLPELIPDMYVLKILNIPSKENSTPIIKNISGEKTSSKIEKTPLGHQYQIILEAISEGGVSEPALLFREIEYPIPLIEGSNKWHHFSSLLIILTICFTIVFGIIIFILILNKKTQKKKFEGRGKYFQEIEQKSTKQNLTVNNDSTVSSDECEEYCAFELPRDRVIINRVLGEGAFGIVRHGWLLPNKQEIAIKMLKESANPEDIQQLKQEIEMMKTAGSHNHLVSMVGCCTQGKSNEIMLLVEYCALGDLLGYLRKSWNSIQQQCPTPTTPLYDQQKFFQENLNNISPSLKINQMYGIDENDENIIILTPIDLISFARQIAIGMEYLSSNRIVHRDLAARNILLTANRTLKIADFGLSRDIYQENIYRKTGNGKLPIKWMALESLTHQIYTSQSDVWSFGIVLWEIVTLGGNPYPSIPTNRLLSLLNSGYRMECPPNCSEEIYVLMKSCWEQQPKQRPTFHELRVALEGFIENNTPAKYLNLDELTKLEYSREDDIEESSTDTPEETSDSYIIETPAFSNFSYDCNNIFNNSYEL